jgi:hypothetical protein
MAGNRKARGILALALIVGVTAWGFSFDVKSFPSPIQKNSVLISGGLAIGVFAPPDEYKYSALFGGSVAVDYALPINFALTVGGEVGYSGGRLKADDDDFGGDISLGEIPIAIRVAWHPNWEVSNLDTYALVKVGYGIGFWLGDDVEGVKNPRGLIIGSNVGVRYFFIPALGVFLEGGYEFHFLRIETETPMGVITSTSYGLKFITLGVTWRL